jgi:peptide/nickel transport system substrate-binding protein
VYPLRPVVAPRRPAFMLVVSGAVLTLAVGDASARLPRMSAADGGTLRVASPVDATFDPALANPAAYAVWYTICAPLMMFSDRAGAAGFHLRPEAAERPPTITGDGRTYVFTIRKDLRFSDGTSITAANFAAALRRVLNPVMQSEAAALFADVKQISAAGRRLRITLRRPSGDFTMRLASANGCPVPLGFPVDAAGVELTVGSGPYYLARHVPDKLIVFQRNRYYRGARPHHADQIVATIGGDLDDNIRAVEEGDADVLAIEINREARDALVQRYGLNKRQFFRTPDAFTTALVLNTSRPLFRDNVSLRKAVNFAVDRSEIVRQAHASPAWFRKTDQIVPPGIPGWKDYDLYPLSRPNLVRARRLAAGNLRGGKAVLYAAASSPGILDQANVVVRNLRAIGLEVTIKPMSVNVLNARAGTPGEPYDMILAGFAATYPDPAGVLIHLLGGENARKPSGNDNFAYFDNPSFDRRLAAANRLLPPARYRAFAALDVQIMRTQAPWAPLFSLSKTLLVSKRVDCLKVHPVYVRDYAAMCVR